ncbi:glycosyltransferase family 39 protein [bacterium]|nr:glycosyltransferase family 39 protein [bacterium]
MKRTTKIFLGILLLSVILRIPSYIYPILDIDESQFAVFANTLLDGGSPYIDTVDTKPLFVYYFFTVIFWIFGKNNMIAIHFFTAIWVGVTALFCFRIGKHLYNERSGLLAALFYVIFTTTYIPKFISTNIVILMMLPLTVSIFYFLKWEEDHSKKWLLFLSGIFLMIGALFKYQGGMNLFVIAFYLLIFRPLFLRKTLNKPKIWAFSIFFSGAIVMYLIYLLHLHLMGVLDDYYFWSIKGSMAYIDAGKTVIDVLRKFFVRSSTFIVSTFLIWFFGVREILRLFKNIFISVDRTKEQTAIYVLFFWFLFSIYPVTIGGRYYGHYFIQLLPALCILASYQVDRFLIKLPVMKPKAMQWAYVMFMLGILLPSVAFFGARMIKNQIYSWVGEDNPDDYRPVARYIMEKTSVDDHIFVWGFATPIYFYADRKPASRFTWCDWVTGRIAGSKFSSDPKYTTSNWATEGAWRMLFDDFNKNKPVYFVDTAIAKRHGYENYLIEKFPYLQEYVDQHYEYEANMDGMDIYVRR